MTNKVNYFLCGGCNPEWGDAYVLTVNDLPYSTIHTKVHIEHYLKCLKYATPNDYQTLKTYGSTVPDLTAEDFESLKSREVR